MPVVPPVVIPNQVLPNGALPYVQQQNFGQMQGEIAAYNPNALAQLPNWINDSTRKIYGKKTWYGLFTKGQIATPQAVSAGTATVTLNSPIVQGNGTAWDQTLIGRTFRMGVNAPLYNIIGVNFGAQQLTLELPWAAQIPPSSNTFTSGYYIVQYYFVLGPNVKYIKTMVNMQMAWKLRTNYTQDYLDSIDPWRMTTNFPRAIAPMPADPNGNYVVELWPASWTQQALPFLMYRQPPNLVDDNDTLPPYIRCDLVTTDVIGRALRYKPKENPAYSEQGAINIAADFDNKMRELLIDAANEDENLYRTSSTIRGEDYPYWDDAAGGGLYAATHAVMAGAGGDDFWG